jgi:lysophospholipase L1-like esterase
MLPPFLLSQRRALRLAGALVLVSLTSAYTPASAVQHQAESTRHWVATWGTAPAGPPLPSKTMTFNDQTLRLIVHTTIGGTQVRIRVSNELGASALRIDSAHVALRQSGSTIVKGTDRVLTFGGMQSITIAPGAPVLSDPVELNVPALSELAVSLHLPGQVQASTIHGAAFQTNYVSLPGNFADAETLPTDRTMTSWPFLTEVDVSAPGAAAIVALGDSITDGSNTTLDANHRRSDLLAQRLQAASALFSEKHGNGAMLAVINRGIGGNRLLRDPGEQPLFGKSALARFDRDVLATAGVKYLIMLIGINDIGHPGTGTIPSSDEPSVQDLIAGYRQLIARAHEKGITVYGATLTPFEGTTFSGYYSPEKEAIREGVNNWIRDNTDFDGVIDFDQAMRDPAHPTRLLPAYDSGDHLHPNDRGMQAMADAIPLALFAGSHPKASHGSHQAAVGASRR